MKRWLRVLIVGVTAALAFAGGMSLAGLAEGSRLPVRLRAALAAPAGPDVQIAVPRATAAPDEDAGDWSRLDLPPTATSTPRNAAAATATAPPVPLPTSTPIAPIATLAPQLAPVSEPTAAPVVEVQVEAAAFFPADAPRIALAGLRHEWQTWNNCGPATLATLLSFWGSPLNQADIGSVLRRSPDDKNVSPHELVSFAESQGMVARLRVNGDGALMRTLLANGFPVLVETWLEEHPNDGMGHYRLLTGYDDALGGWIAYDSYVSTGLLGGGAKNGSDSAAYAGILMPYAETDALWKVFNRTYLLVYPPKDAARVGAILAAHAGSGAGPDDGDAMWQASESTARAEIAANAGDAFAWFNLGSTLWELGRADEAATAFDQARTIGLPWRMYWYQFAPFAAYHAVGRDDAVLELANSTLANVDSVEEVFYWKGIALHALGDAAGGRSALERALALAPNYAEAAAALRQ